MDYSIKVVMMIIVVLLTIIGAVVVFGVSENNYIRKIRTEVCSKIKDPINKQTCYDNPRTYRN